jgi:hypothetical protein
MHTAVHCVKRRLSDASCSETHIYLRIGHSSIGHVLQGVENCVKLSGRARTGVEEKARFANGVTKCSARVRCCNLQATDSAFVECS